MASIENWVKLQKETFQKPEVRAIAKALGITPVHAAGCCAAFWCYADSHMRDGFIPLTDQSDIDAMAQEPGFAAALELVEWARFADGGIHIPKPDLHLSQGAKGRAETNARQHKSRVSKKLKGDDAPARRPVTRKRDTPSQESVTREEESREEKTTSASQKGEREEEAEVEIRAAKGEWVPILDALIAINLRLAATTISVGQGKGYTPKHFRDLLAHYRIDPEKHGGPGAIYTRVCCRGPDTPADKGWGSDVKAPSSAPARSAITADEQWRIDRIKALEPIHGRQEAKRMVDAELAQTAS
jgi:hypothetical protein